jgi:O-acetyl-ADP-ribose deacetylase (regulator of RNase III)
VPPGMSPPLVPSGQDLGVQVERDPAVVEGDLLDQDVDVIVNAWNRNVIPWWLLLPHGVSKAIKRRAGYAPFRELRRHGPIPLGGAVLTGAGRLPYKGIIHVAGIDLLWRASERSIRSSARSAMGIVNDHAMTSVAFPVVGAGAGGLALDWALETIVDELGSIPTAADVLVVTFDTPSGPVQR